MSSAGTPVKLGREPIIDAIFEVRFEASTSASGVLPGYLFSKLQGVERVEPLPAGQIPEAFRAADPNFRYIATSRLHWGKFLVLIGQHNLGLACKLPYPGWSAFRVAILDLLKSIVDAPFIGPAERCSLKYINLIEDVQSHAQAFETFNIDVRIGGHRATKENTSLRVEMERGGFLHAVTIATAASVQLDGVPNPKLGAMLDVDTMTTGLRMNMVELSTAAPDLIQGLHDSNHQVFFDCLTKTGLERLDPRYE